jgi:hypothetical protein
MLKVYTFLTGLHRQNKPLIDTFPFVAPLIDTCLRSFVRNSFQLYKRKLTDHFFKGGSGYTFAPEILTPNACLRT